MFSAKTPADLLQPGCVGLEVDALGPDVPGPGQTRGASEAEQSAVMLTHHVVLTVRRGEAILDVLLEVRAPACVRCQVILCERVMSTYRSVSH